jgi:Serine/threonine protein phosphatase
MTSVYYAADSVQGVHRKVNKDLYGIFINEEYSRYLYVVFDGVSSEQNAKYGARMAYRFFEHQFVQQGSKFNLTETVLHSSERLQKSKYSNPYTTVCAAYIDASSAKPVVQIASLGDTRLYVVKPTSMQPVTIDHTVKGHKNVLTRYLGMEGLKKDDIFFNELPCEGMFLICSDGFYSLLEAMPTVFHGIFTDIRINNFAKEIGNLVKNNNIDDATYIFVRVENV